MPQSNPCFCELTWRINQILILISRAIVHEKWANLGLTSSKDNNDNSLGTISESILTMYGQNSVKGVWVFPFPKDMGLVKVVNMIEQFLVI